MSPPTSASPKGQRLRFGICGAGSFGAYFAGFVAEIADVTAISDPNPTARAEFQAQMPSASTYSDYREMFDSAPIDAVVIASPNDTHCDITVAASAAGKHVFCEKPMAIDVRECQTMVAACEAAGVRLMVGHKRRLRPPWERMIELRERLGPVVATCVTLYFDARPYDHHGWVTSRRACGGTLYLSGVHTVDWLHALCGPTARVRAVAGTQVDKRYEFADCVHVTLEYCSGAVASLNVALRYPLAQFRESVGPTVVCRDGGMRLHAALDHIQLEYRHHDDHKTTIERFDDLGYEVAYRRELAEFVAFVTEGREPSLTAADGLRAVEVMEAVELSLATGGSVVTLPLYPELEPI